MEFLPFKNNLEDLDPSYKTDLDLCDCFGLEREREREKNILLLIYKTPDLHIGDFYQMINSLLVNEEIRYVQTIDVNFLTVKHMSSFIVYVQRICHSLTLTVRRTFDWLNDVDGLSHNFFAKSSRRNGACFSFL